MTAASAAQLSTLNSQPSAVSRFAILIHDHPFVHWDLLLENGETARTWRLLESPARWLLAKSCGPLPAEAIAAHRLMYLNYEGPVSRERGTVACFDRGHWEATEWSECIVRARITGPKLRGELSLIQPSIGSLWSARFRPD